MQDNIAKQIARWVALGALFLIPFAPLVVADSFYFPFITGKAFFLRITIEIAFAAWVVLAFLDRAYRPRLSAIGIAVLAFVAWMFVADAAALNAAKAFWSNFERMEGWVLLAHLLGFFFAASAVLRVEKKWRAWFLTSLAVSIIIGIHALLQLAGAAAVHQGSVRIDASFGNSAYLAVYLLFNVFIALWLALTERLSWLKWALIALAAVEAMFIFFTETRGAILGLVGALALAALLTVLTAGDKARRLAAVALALLIVLAGGFYLARDSAFVQGNHVLQRVASISLADGATRFTIWKMAAKGTLERPLTGWGQEGFNYVFNKYYDPSLYRQEPWFDRAHNAFIDWLSAGGVPAFVLYLALFGSALMLLWKSTELSRPERIALTAALFGYAIHNTFVFDNLYSYIYFFAILALVDSQTARSVERIDRLPVLSPAGGMTYALPIAAVALLVVWSVNIPGMQASKKLIAALSNSSGSIETSIRTFEELTAHPSFAAQEIREQLVSFANAVVRSPSATNEEKQRTASLAIREMQKQVAAYPLDARNRLELSYAYRSVGDGAGVLSEIRAAIALSPRKEGFWIEAGAVEWDLGNVEAAREDFNTAYALGPQFPELAAYAAAGNIAAGDQAAADQILMEAYGTTLVDSDVLSVAYYRVKDWPRLIGISKARTEKAGAPVEAWFSLAAAYYESGDRAKAIATIRKTVELYPSSESTGASIIAQIEGK